jgi:hypothetical protein
LTSDTQPQLSLRWLHCLLDAFGFSFLVVESFTLLRRVRSVVNRCCSSCEVPLAADVYLHLDSRDPHHTQKIAIPWLGSATYLKPVLRLLCRWKHNVDYLSFPEGFDRSARGPRTRPVRTVRTALLRRLEAQATDTLD